MQRIHRKKTWLALAVVFVVLFSLTGCGRFYLPEGNRNFRVVETAYFRAAIHKVSEPYLTDNPPVEDYAVVYELTDLGKERAVLAIPSFVEGVPVTDIGWGQKHGGFSAENIGFESDKLKKVYVPYTVKSVTERVFQGCELEEIVIQSATRTISGLQEGKATLITTKEFFEDWPITPSYFKQANILYYFNYVEAVNLDYHWVDYITGENLHLESEEPTREGYTFTGWYLEPECITKGNGALPTSAEEKLELYAGWDVAE